MQTEKYKITDPRKCPIHRQWMKKGQCEQCLMARDKERKHYELVNGSHKPPVIIRKI